MRQNAGKKKTLKGFADCVEIGYWSVVPWVRFLEPNLLQQQRDLNVLEFR